MLPKPQNQSTSLKRGSQATRKNTLAVMGRGKRAQGKAATLQYICSTLVGCKDVGIDGMCAWVGCMAAWALGWGGVMLVCMCV